MRRPSLSAGLALLIVSWLASAEALAQSYPSKPVRIIVPFGAGGPGDTYTRLLAQHLSESMKQPFIVETRPGAGAIIGSEAVAKSPPDGYTLLIVSNAHTTNESLNPNRPFSLMKDFVTVAPVNYADLILVTNPNVEAKTLRELIALAKAKPGQINYASSGIGTVYHMSGELLKTTAGIEIVHVPHRASGDMRNSVLGGHVQMMFDAITTIEPMIRAGQVRTIATTGLKRAPSTPDVPTMSESGADGFETNIWFGLMAPAGTSPEIVARLDGEVHRALARPEIGAVWSAQGVTPWTVSRAAFDKFLRDDIAKWEKVVKATGVKLN
ncbi:MAG: tripartite tricarboxylate transporter substrate binding protein [Hyphomicrobiales bacterium]|nr:tripartite tricarboxylate transporter substrate binding protein [Hyphomicrobiales bacterium]